MGLAAFQRFRREQTKKDKDNTETKKDESPTIPSIEISKATKSEIEAYVKAKYNIDLDKRKKVDELRAYASGLDEGKAYEEIEAELAGNTDPTGEDKKPDEAGDEDPAGDEDKNPDEADEAKTEATE